ncbi:hypothetical protein ACIHDR_46195 [Nocardia sp. NPDC052278]|uniref:hypothetical protein n=1 Tax=Nocardia sp. NPDC052278 TaxID=3364328 RepID=UPI0037C8B93E
MIRIDAGHADLVVVREIRCARMNLESLVDETKAGWQPVKPWPTPVPEVVWEFVRAHAFANPARGHRKIWSMFRHGGRRVSEGTVARILREEGGSLLADYQRERRKLAQRTGARSR